LRFTVDEGAGLTPRKILSKPIKQLEVERPVEARLKRSFCHVHPVMRLTGQLEIRKVVSIGWSSSRSRRNYDVPIYGLFCYPARDKTGSPFDLMADEAWAPEIMEVSRQVKRFLTVC
jgi:hypothetical protein